MTTRFEYACDTCTATRVIEFDPIRVGREWRDEDMPDSVPCGRRGCMGRQERVDMRPTIIKNSLLRRQVFTGCEFGNHHHDGFSLSCNMCVIGAIGNLTDMVAGLQQELRKKS